LQIQATRLRVDFLHDPIGIDEVSPRFSWWITDVRADARQSAYRVRVASTQALLEADSPDLWDSGKVNRDQQAHIEYHGKALKSRTRAFWDVQLCDATGIEGKTSARSTFEIGLLERDDFEATFIQTPLEGTGQTMAPVPVLRKSFVLSKPVGHARLYITALGIYEAHINGSRVSDDYFRPGWTDYRKRLQYQTYDVTGLIRQGENAIATILADGWYAGRVAHTERGILYGTRPALMAQLEVTHTDGSVTRIVTDDTWAWFSSPILGADFLQGEEYDARKEVKNWNDVNFNGSTDPVETIDWPAVAIVAPPNEPVRVVKEILPLAEPKKVSGGWNASANVYDFGQNFAGTIRFKVKGPRGATIRFRYAEMLNADGTMYTANLRSARVIDTYTLRGDPQGETFSPRFTFHGFRYVEVSFHDHWSKHVSPLENPTIESLVGLVLMSDTKPTGSFECSHAGLNKLQQNIQWGQRGNFLEVPTDCPQRDERLGWTGDAQVFAPTAAFNMDVAAFFTKWSRDIDDAQQPDGRVPCIAPRIDELEDGGPGWSDARVVCAWSMHQAYADQRQLKRHYPQMKKWLEWQASTRNDVGLRCYAGAKYFDGFSDWLALDSTWQSVWSATPKDFIGTAYFAYSAGIMRDIASTLGNDHDASLFATLRQQTVDGFNKEFVTLAGRLSVQTQTAYLFALAFDLLPEPVRPIAFERLMKLFEERKWHLSTGFLGTPLICPVLTRFGRVDLAYKILLQQDYPGWLFPVANGATTMWERWNSWTPDKGFGDPGMNSFNHYAYGAIGRFMYDHLAGLAIDPSKPGYKNVIVSPKPCTEITFASASIDSIHGPIRTSWTVESGTFKLEVHLPPGVTATVELPSGSRHRAGSGATNFKERFVATN